MLRPACTLFALGALGLAGGPASASPGDRNAQAFYADAQALQGKGMGALLDGRLRPMMAAMKDAGTRVRAENGAAAAKGAPLYCVPPAARKKGMSGQQAIELLGTVPLEQRQRMTLVEAWRAALAARYPCG